MSLFITPNDKLSHLLCPTMYKFFKDNDGAVYISDHQGFVISKDEAKQLIDGLEKFIEYADESMIEEHNETRLNDYLYPEKKGTNKNTPKHKIMSGYVYFLKADNGLIKIGKTVDLNKRLDHFTTKLPYKPTLIHVIDSYDYTSLEAELHEKYKHLRKRGEWFKLTDKDIEEIISEYGDKHTA